VRLTMRGNAYAGVSFEREAYAHQGELDYLKHRRHYAWRGYLCKKNNKQK
jgi:putative membrane protein